MGYVPRRLRTHDRKPKYAIEVDLPLTEDDADEIRRKALAGLRSGVFVHGPHISVRKL